MSRTTGIFEPIDELGCCLSETDHATDPQSIQQWIEGVQHLHPLIEPSPAERDAMSTWEVELREFNLAAIRQQFEGGC